MRHYSLVPAVVLVLSAGLSPCSADTWAGTTWANPPICGAFGSPYVCYGNNIYSTTAGAPVTPQNFYINVSQEYIGTLPNCGCNLVSFSNAGEISLSDFASSSTVEALSNQLSKYAAQSNKGIAMAYALAGVPDLHDDEHIAFAGNWGTFASQNAFAVGAAYRLTDHVSANAGLTASADGQQFGGRVGFRVGW